MKQEIYGSLIRLRTDPVGVMAEAKAFEKLSLRLKVLLTED